MVFLTAGDYNTFPNVNGSSVSSSGIMIMGLRNTLVNSTGISDSGPGKGIELIAAFNGTVLDSRGLASGTGISLTSSDNNIINGSLGSGSVGIDVASSMGNSVINSNGTSINKAPKIPRARIIVFFLLNLTI